MFGTLLAIAAVVAIATVFVVVFWSKRPPPHYAPEELRPPPAKVAPAFGAFNIHDPVHLLAGLAVGALVLVFLGVF